jgi:hypothetical protein
MTRMVAKLLLLMAVLLMPLGMTAPAAARQHHSASMPMKHCPDQAPQPTGKAGFAQCTMACSAALPAMDASTGEALTIVCTPELPAAVQRLHGVQPDTATPPPKAP